MRVTNLIAFLLLSALATHGAQPAEVLIGRWQAQAVETGYWVIDRYPDGRYAEKSFLTHDYSKPSEIVVSWGHWKIRGKRYLYVIDGSTSAFVRRFAGQWKTTRIVSLTPKRFDFLSSDDHPRYELPLASTEPLLNVVVSAPPDLRGVNRTILEPDLRSVPAWVNGCPAHRTPNQAMQRTAGRSAFPLSMTSTFNQQRRAPSPAVADLVSR
jgi:hypothetical protein